MLAAAEADSLELFDAIRFDHNGLVTVVVQQHDTGVVLMVAWMNREALATTLRTGEMCYWSRSRAKLWHKGESSGQFQKLIDLRLDCDGDSLLAAVDQRGVACHTGRLSCFYRQATAGKWVTVAPVKIPPETLYASPPPDAVDMAAARPMLRHNRRAAWRFIVPSDQPTVVDLVYQGYPIELSLRDLSLSGAAIEDCGLKHLQAGGPCLVRLPGGEELPGRIVAITGGLVRIQFTEKADDDIRQLVHEMRKQIL